MARGSELKYKSILLLLFLQIFIIDLSYTCAEAGEERTFRQFSLILPDGWDGEEQTGFISDNPEEYLLVLGKKDAEAERFLAQISIYLLPNRPGVDAKSAAKTLAQSQGDTSPPVLEGNMWTFTGEPRTNVIKGMAKTMVNTNKEKMLIIIAQDPDELGAAEIITSIKGIGQDAKTLLGR